MKTTQIETTALTPSLESCLKAIETARPCEQASYVHLEGETRQAVDMLIALGLVVIVNSIPRPAK